MFCKETSCHDALLWFSSHSPKPHESKSNDQSRKVGLAWNNWNVTEDECWDCTAADTGYWARTWLISCWHCLVSYCTPSLCTVSYNLGPLHPSAAIPTWVACLSVWASTQPAKTACHILCSWALSNQGHKQYKNQLFFNLFHLIEIHKKFTCTIPSPFSNSLSSLLFKW